MDYSGLSDAQPTTLASVQRCVYIFNVSSAERSSGIRITRFRWQTNLLAFCDRLDLVTSARTHTCSMSAPFPPPVSPPIVFRKRVGLAVEDQFS
jgi:hypothetical protein